MTRPVALIAALLVAGALPAWGEELRITITKTDCARLMRHQPSADVAFKPGEGVRGRKVAPADLPGSGSGIAILPDMLEIPITINPINYGERLTAQKARADAAKAVTANDKAIAAAQAGGTTLAAEKAALDATYTAYMARYTEAQNRVVALTGGTSPTTAQSAVRAQQLEEVRRHYLESATYTKLVAERSAKAAAIAANDAAIATGQASKTTLRTAYDETEYAATAAESGAAAKGLDKVGTTVGVVKYDFAKGTFTLNGQPLGSPEQQELAEKCRSVTVR